MRKRTCSCLGSLAVILAPKQLTFLVSTLLKNINPKDKAKSFAFIETLGAVSDTVSYRLAPNLNAIMQALKIFCKIKPAQDTTPADIDHDVKEVCLRVFDNSIKKCPKEAASHLDDIMGITLELMGYDPNYNPDVVMNEAGEDMEAWGNVMEEEPRVEDDSSWKVRRSAVRILGTMVKYRNDIIKAMYEKVIARVLERLCEREESIKCEILSTFSNMIKGAVVGAPSSVDEIETAMLLKRKSSAEYLLKDLPAAISQIIGHYGDKSQKVREAIASLLLNMAIAVPDTMNGSLLGTVLPPLVTNFKDNSSTIKIIVLQVLRRLIRTSLSVDGYVAYLKQLLDVFTIAIKEDYFKLPAEALKTAGALVKLLMREEEMPLAEAQGALKTIYGMCNAVFKLSDVDQEIKQAAIYTMGTIAAHASGILDAKKIEDILTILHERLNQEALRLSTIKAFHAIVTSSKKLPIEKKLAECLPEIVQMTHKIARQVKVAGLDTLLGICEKYPSAWEPSASHVLAEIAPLLKEGDLQLTQTTIKVLIYVIPKADDDTLAKFVPIVLELCISPFIQAVLEDAIPMICLIAKREPNAALIVDNLWKAATEKSYRPVSIILANVVMLKEAEIQYIVERYAEILSSAKAPEQQRKMAAIILGYIGQKRDLSKAVNLNKFLSEPLKIQDEEVKIHAAICLGNIALGNKEHYIPIIISKLKSTQELSYLMLVALREIVVQDHQGVVKNIADILPALRAQSDTDDEGDRTIIAEIIGKLLLAQESVIAPEVEKNLANPKENVRATFALSFKYWNQKSKKKK